ncbi:MAG: SDR family oxidoreductase [Bacteroidia bacterium]|nr:SDR family oxidoreductase [Bacteroidia bacterium]
MNILIIGSNGFIGSHCVSTFSAKGNYVYGCDVQIIDQPNYISIAQIQHDFTKLFEDQIFDFCINAAGSANVAYSYQHPEKDFELNVSLVINLLSAIKTFCPKCKFINFSSAAVYGNPSELPVREDSTLMPLSPYGYHKMLSEKLLHEYHHFFKLKTCSLRVFSAYGPGLKKQLFWDIYQKLSNKNTINLYGKGTETRDFIYISDLIQALECIMNNTLFIGEVINVATGTETTINTATKYFIENFEDKFELVFNGIEKEGDPKNWKAEIRILEEMGFKQLINLQTGLSKYADWLKSNKQL